MKLEITQRLHAQWRKLKGQRRAPERNDIDPSVIRDVLADAFILEFGQRSGFPFRVVGTRVTGLFQRDLRGEPFLDRWRPGDRWEVADILETVADDSCPWLVRAAGGPSAKEAVELEILLLPLRHYGDPRARVLGSCARDRTPYWLGLAPIGPIAMLSLTSLRDEEPNASFMHTGATTLPPILRKA